MSDLVEPLPGVAPAVRRHPATGYALYLLAAALFALNGTISKSILLSGIDPARLSQLRVTTAFLILLVVVALTRPQALRIRRSEVPVLLAFGILGIAMTQYLYFVAISLLPVGIALLIEFTAPIMVALWFRFGLHERVNRRVWAGLALAMLGLALVGQVWQGFTLDGLGVIAAFGAAAALALYYLLGDRQVRQPEPRDPVSLTMWGFGAASLFWAVVQPWWSFPWSALTGVGHPLGESGSAVPLWVLCSYMVVLGTVVPFWLVVVSMQHIRASQASVIGMTEPLLASLIAWIALGEILTPSRSSAPSSCSLGSTSPSGSGSRSRSGPAASHPREQAVVVLVQPGHGPDGRSPAADVERRIEHLHRPGGRGHIVEPVPRPELLVLPHPAQIVDPRSRDARGRQPAMRLRCRQRTQPLHDDRLQLGDVLDPRRVRREARVGAEGRIAQHRPGHRSPLDVALHGDEDGAPVAQREGPVRRDRVVASPRPRRLPGSMHSRIQGGGHPLDEGVEHGDADGSPAPVRSRRTSAARMPLSAYIAAPMSATEKPTLLISSAPVTENAPASAWIARS